MVPPKVGQLAQLATQYSQTEPVQAPAAENGIVETRCRHATRQETHDFSGYVLAPFEVIGCKRLGRLFLFQPDRMDVAQISRVERDAEKPRSVMVYDSVPGPAGARSEDRDLRGSKERCPECGEAFESPKLTAEG